MRLPGVDQLLEISAALLDQGLVIDLVLEPGPCRIVEDAAPDRKAATGAAATCRLENLNQLVVCA